MSVIHSIKIFFWEIDPGYFNLKRAFKTVLAIVISLLIVADDLFMTQMMAGIGSGIAMQGVDIRSRRIRVIHVLVFTLIYFLVFCLGLYVRSSQGLTAITLLLLGFSVNYFRRFNMEKSIVPFMVWIICFLATIIPFDNIETAWWHIYGLLVGLIVATIVTLLVFPDNYNKLFRKNTNLYFRTLRHALEGFSQQVISPLPIYAISQLPSVQASQSLLQCAESNQTIINSSTFKSYDDKEYEITTFMFALNNAFGLLVDAYIKALKQEIFLPQTTKDTLRHICKEFSDFLLPVYFNRSLEINPKNVERFVSQYSKNLGDKPVKGAGEIMILLNMKLRFELLSKNLNQMIKVLNGA